MSRIPKTTGDAETAYGDAEESDARWQSVGILEVLKTRNGDGDGKWAAFEMRDGVELVRFE